MASKKQNKLGFDPLAWMNGPSEDEIQAPAKRAKKHKAAVSDDKNSSSPRARRKSAELTVKEGGERPVAEKDSGDLCVQMDGKKDMSASGQSPQELSCNDVLGMEKLHALHEQLAAAIKSGRPVIIDMKRVTSIHAAILQLLAVVLRDGADNGVVITLQPSQEVFDSAELLGMRSVLNLATDHLQARQ